MPHSCNYEGKLLNELFDVAKKIEKTCNSLSLSFKVINAYLK